MSIKLRHWQQEALNKALRWLVLDENDSHFLINAAPGSGKTIAACAIAAELLARDKIDRVVVIAPRSEVVNQWADDFQFVTGRYMAKVTPADHDVNAMGLDVCATWAAIQGLSDVMQAICRSGRVLVICDEHHHAAVKAAWGDGTDGAFSEAIYRLILTGTPIRTDGMHSIWLAYDDNGAIDHPEDGTYTLSYGQAVDLEYCRPVTFHRHEGKFTVEVENGLTLGVSSQTATELPPELTRIPSLQRSLDFYHLACTPQYQSDGKMPLLDGYQGTMVNWASDKLNELRYRMPNAGGLVIAPNIQMAEYMTDLIEAIEGDRPILVHSQMPNAEKKIKAFRNTDKRWIVSVAMISEGVDIKRLRVLIYLPNAMTELAFRQAIGRVVRSSSLDDDTRAYVVMPSLKMFDDYARRIEEELPARARKDQQSPKTKRCPICASENELSSKLCVSCGHEFPAIGSPRMKRCSDCGAFNLPSANSCQECGHSFEAHFTLTLNEALRCGAIVRGMYLDEDEVAAGENLARPVRKKVLETGDEKLIHLLRTLPEESYARLHAIMSDDR